jgi:hypothetical protein
VNISINFCESNAATHQARIKTLISATFTGIAHISKAVMRPDQNASGWRFGAALLKDGNAAQA